MHLLMLSFAVDAVLVYVLFLYRLSILAVWPYIQLA